MASVLRCSNPKPSRRPANVDLYVVKVVSAAFAVELDEVAKRTARLIGNVHKPQGVQVKRAAAAATTFVITVVVDAVIIFFLALSLSVVWAVGYSENTIFLHFYDARLTDTCIEQVCRLTFP